MILDKYIIVSREGRRYSYRLKAEMKEREPQLNGNEIAVHLRLDIPDALFDRPMLEAKMALPADVVPKVKITPEITSNLESIIKERTGLNLRVGIAPIEDDETPPPSNKSRRKVDAPVIEDGDFTNMQVFKKGDKVRFYITNPKDEYAGVHTVTAVQKVEVGHIIQTDKSKGNWIHVHWFAPVRK